MSNELTTQNKSLISLHTVEDMKVLAKSLRPSKPESETLALILASYQLGLNGNIEGLHYGDGRVIMDSHIIRGKAISAGIKITTLEDYVQECEYIYGSREKGEVIDEAIYKLDPNAFYVVYTQQQFIAIRDNAEICKNKVLIKTNQQLVLRTPIDSYRTTIKFERNGQIEIVSQNSYEFAIAGLLDKNTYKKYPKMCFYARVCTLGVKRIASDTLCGLTTLIDYYDSKGIDVPLAEIQEF